MKNYLILLLLSSTMFSIFSCNDDKDDVVPVISLTVTNLPADPTTGYDPNTGAPIGGTGHFTFFNLKDSTIIPLSDSATSKWDIAFNASTIILNGGISGPANAAAYIYNGIFNDLQRVSEDSIFNADTSGKLAIGKSWSTYDPVSKVLNATPGKVLVVRTADNKYAKVEILSYYKNAPAKPNYLTDVARYYTFRYVYQGNGTKLFNE